jgi:FkbM family methyltransferase
MRTDLRHRLRRLYFNAWAHATPVFSVGGERGPRLAIPGDHRAAATLADWSPNWKSRLIAAVLAHRQGAFLDIGANIGQTLIDFCAADADRPYIGFEPNPRCVEVLDDLVRANGLRRCLVVPVGLSNATGIARLLSRPGSETDSGASIDATLRPGRVWDVSLVPCFPLDEIREPLGIDGIALVKIDVEGAELAVLEGMRRTIANSAPWIACEVLHRDRLVSAEQHQGRLDGLQTFLRDVGYAILRVRKRGDGSGDIELSTVDAFPNEVHSTENGFECDYLFVPRDDTRTATRLGWAA